MRNGSGLAYDSHLQAVIQSDPGQSSIFLLNASSYGGVIYHIGTSNGMVKTILIDTILMSNIGLKQHHLASNKIIICHSFMFVKCCKDTNKRFPGNATLDCNLQKMLKMTRRQH